MPSTPKPPKPTTYRFIGDRPMILEGGAPLGPGEYVELTEDQITGITQIAISDGRLIDASGVAGATPQEMIVTPASIPTPEEEATSEEPAPETTA